MKVLVTGGAGFVGSHTVETLAKTGNVVSVLDNFNDYYDPALKRQNLQMMSGIVEGQHIEADLCRVDLEPIVADHDAIIHLAGQPGVRRSWKAFDTYVEANITATHRLAQAILTVNPACRLVFASSSSVYGPQDSFPTTVNAPVNPQSPYGVSKLAAEKLLNAYADGFGLNVVSLRYFTVYGPRQRPDMAFQRIILAGLQGGEFTLFGDGKQVRDFTYVGDIAEANAAAMNADIAPGTVLNVGGGEPQTMLDVLEFAIEQMPELVVSRREAMVGDARQTGSDTAETRRLLNWEPQTTFREGFINQIHYERALGTYGDQL